MILLAQEKDQIPFDLQFYQFVIYKGNLENLQSQLAQKIQWAIAESKKQSQEPPISLGEIEKPLSAEPTPRNPEKELNEVSFPVLPTELESYDFYFSEIEGKKRQELLLKLEELRGKDNDQHIEQKVASIKRLVELGEKDLPLHDFNLSGASLENIDLSGADLRNVNFDGANIQGANIQGADLNGAIFRRSDIEGADFQEADLQGARFEAADLKGTSFYKADLQKAVFKDVQLKDVVLSEAILKNVDFSGFRLPGFDFSGKNLEGVNFKDTYLRNANFQEAVLKKANFQGAYLYGADFKDADLEEVDFKEADLRKADLTGADLFLSKLSFAKGLTSEMLLQVKSLYGVIGLEASLSERLKQENQKLFDAPFRILLEDMPKPPI